LFPGNWGVTGVEVLGLLVFRVITTNNSAATLSLPDLIGGGGITDRYNELTGDTSWVGVCKP